VLINCRVKNRKDLESIKGYKELITEVESELKGEGRIFVRFSGTEPVIRVLVEGPNKVKISELADRVASFLDRELS
jgi:phosphoglucosamine mutase